jgi:hypothetical protein
MLTLGFGYWYLNVRIRPLMRPVPPSPRTAQWVFFYTGIAFLWVASDWPLHDLAEASLYWGAHGRTHGPHPRRPSTPHHGADQTNGGQAIRSPFRLPVATTSRSAGGGVHHLQPGSHRQPLARSGQPVAPQRTRPLPHPLVPVPLRHPGLAPHHFPFQSPTTVAATDADGLPVPLNSIIPIVPAEFLTFSAAAIYTGYCDASLEFGLTDSYESHDALQSPSEPRRARVHVPGIR